MTELAIVRENSAPQSLEDWKTYIAAASAIEKRAGQALVDAIIEKGRRIAEFHAAYKAKPQQWGKRWERYLHRNNWHYRESMAVKYMTVGKNILRGTKDILPTSVETLYCLSSIARKDTPAFDAAVAVGEINPKMTLPKARALVERIRNNGPQNITSANYVRRPPSVSRPAPPAEELARIRAMPEKMVSIHVLIEELHPLFERVMTQAKVHQARVSQGELGTVASLGQKLLEQWASDDPTVRRMRGHVVPFKQPAMRKKG